MIPVHCAGQQADMDDLMTIAAEKELIVIEDEGHGGEKMIAAMASPGNSDTAVESEWIV